MSERTGTETPMILSVALTMQSLAAEHGAGVVPHSDAEAQDALNGASIESVHDGG